MNGRTWERRYELLACRTLAQALLELEAQQQPREVQQALRDTTTIAVFPFRYSLRSGFDPFVVEGLAEEIAARLLQRSSLTILSATAARRWAQSPDPLLAARDAGADFVINGHVSSAANGLRFRVRIDETARQTTRWSTSFESRTDDLLQADHALADAILEALGRSQDHLSTSKVATNDPIAYEHYLRGLGLVFRSSERETAIAIALFDRALDRDPGLARAHAYKGYALWRQYASSWDAGQPTLDRALDCVDRALAIDPRCAAARLTRIRVCWDTGWHEQALREGRRALVDSGYSNEAKLGMARAMKNAGLADLAVPIIRGILEREPAAVPANRLLIWALLLTGDYVEAAAESRAYFARHGTDANTARATANAFLSLNDYPAALEIVKIGLQADPTDAPLWLLKGDVYQVAGTPETARETWLDGYRHASVRLRTANDNPRLHAWLANLSAAAGDLAPASRHSERAMTLAPDNAYLHYRLMRPAAEINNASGALAHLRSAIDHGFLSRDLQDIETRYLPSHLTSSTLCLARAEELRAKTARLRGCYEPLAAQCGQ